jgi:hypothetical protein
MIAKTLGPPFTEWVPATVIRSIWPEDPALAGGFGAFSTGIEGETEVEEPWQNPAYCDPAAFWDALIGQQDRHYGNYRFDIRAQQPPLRECSYNSRGYARRPIGRTPCIA